ncbi:ABC transporter permease [Pseudooceanicola spongiae]|uniref:ABC transporter permease subunit n=1 Tax=Pseudooceanicola spongiae TaxID=2613965 RepID=A0A7L9WRJ9_9RHOB|nr:ABC transporter permease [Pseudooceanicola spongiae]QOL83015.1 ABC transporter permease subunit [Pseudooceanicola spongiae]
MTDTAFSGPRASKSRGLVASMLRTYASAFRRPRGMLGLAILSVIVLAGLASPWLWPGGVDQQSRDSLLGMSLAHPFGTDQLGRDIFMRTIYAAKISLGISVVAVPIGMVLGTLMGLSGMISPRLGTICVSLFDLLLGFPGLILAILIVLMVGTGWLSLVLTISLLSIPQFGRLARGAFLSEQAREYVQAATLLNISKTKIMLRHILPNTLDPLVVQLGLVLINGVFIEAAISLVGLGIQPPTPSLGTLLNSGIRYIYQQPLYAAGPTVLLLLLALSFNLMADALNAATGRDAQGDR